MANLNELIYQNVKGLPSIKTSSDMTNDDSLIVVQNNTTKKASFDFITDYTIESAFAKLPDWIKDAEKPTYTPEEVGADPAGSANSALSSANQYTENRLSEEIDDTVTQLSNKITESKDQSSAYTDAAISELQDDLTAKITTGDSNTLASAKSYTDGQINTAKTTLSEAIDSVNTTLAEAITTGDSNTLASAKSYTDGQINAAKTTLNDNIDSVTTSLSEAITTGDSNTLASAKSYTDGQINAAKTSLSEAISTGDSNTLSSAKSYTNTKTSELQDKIDTLETNVSNQFVDMSEELSTNINSGDTETLASAKTYTDNQITDLTTIVNGKAASSHTHTIANITNLQTTLNGKAANTVFVKSGSGAKAGLVPAPSTTAGTTKYLREDGTWSVPPDTHTDIDTALSTTSTNPVQNKVVTTALNGKAASSHTHAIANITNLSTELDALESRANDYTDDAIKKLVGTAPEALDTLEELAQSINNNSDVYNAIVEKIPIVDTALSTTSTNPVQNKVVATALNGKAASSHTHTAANITDLNTKLSGYLPLSGGAMTGNIRYKGTKATSTAIQFIDNAIDAYGNGIAIGGNGGLTVIGGGESANVIIPEFSVNEEKMIVANDVGIDFYTNCQKGFNSAKHITMNTDGSITAAGFNGKATSAGNADTVNGFTVGRDVPADAEFSDTTYSDATTTTHGLLSVADKKALDILKTPYATCATGRATAAKVATLSNFVLNIGSTIVVKFTDTAGTADPASGNLTLNVNSTGAKNIGWMKNGSKSPLTYANGKYFYNNASHVFTYDGTYWLCMDYNADNNTTYTAGTGLALSGTKFNHSNSVTAGTAQGDANKTLTFGGTFTIPTVTYDAQGHITGKGTTTMTMPANPNVDTKATQTNTTTSADYRLALSYNANDTTETQTLRKSGNFLANPSTGEFYAKGYRRIDITGQTLNINTLNLSAGSPMIMRYIEKTNGGAANITNIPVADYPFILDVELIRWASTTDYITRQIFVSTDNGYVAYIRFCVNGTWRSWIKQVFTDSNLTQTLTTSNVSYPLLLAPSGQTATANATAYFGTGINFNPSTNTLSTTTFKGALSGNASTATALAAGSADRKTLDVLKTPYATCATGRATAAKVATLANFTLSIGATIVVKFTDTAGTANPTSGNLTLNVNNTGAKNIGWMNNGSKGPFTYNSSHFFYNNASHVFTYDGTYWLCMDWNVDYDTRYSNFVKSGSGAKSGLVPAPPTTAGTTKYLREDGTWSVPPDTHTAIDTALSTTSTNPVQNKVVTTALNGKKPWKYCVVGQSGSATTNPWYKFASISTKNNYYDPVITFKVNSCFGTGTTCVGILTAHIRTNGSSQWESSELVWEYAASGIDASKFVMAYNTATSPTICELWVKCDASYRKYQFEVLWEGYGNEIISTTGWQLHSLSSAGSQAAITSGFTQKASVFATLKNAISGRAASAIYLSTFSSNTLTANKSGTWTCFAYANKSTWFPTTGSASRFIRFTVYDAYLENGIYDVALNLLCINNVYTKVLFTANRLDDDNPTTPNIAVRLTDSRIEFWMKQIGASQSTIWISGMITNSLATTTDSSLRGLTAFPSGGTVYYPEYSINTAKYDAVGNVISETYALKTAIPAKLSQLTNDASYAKKSDTVSASYTVYPAAIFSGTNKQNGKWSNVCYWDTSSLAAWANRTVSFILTDLNVGLGTYEIFISIRTNATAGAVAYVKLLADRLDKEESTTDKVALIVTNTQVQLWMKADTNDYVKWLRLNNSGNAMNSFASSAYEYLAALPTDRGKIYYATSRRRLVEKAKADANGNVINTTYTTLNTTQTISGAKTFSGTNNVTGTMRSSGAKTDYTTYRFRNIAMGTSDTPTTDATYGGSGSIYIQY